LKDLPVLFATSRLYIVGRAGCIAAAGAPDVLAKAFVCNLAVEFESTALIMQ
jgi:hypothetical protein